MRPLSVDWATALAGGTLVTALLARLEFRDETSFLWTGPSDLAVSGTGDTKLDSNTFSALAPGVLVSVGENTFSYTGSDAMNISLGIPADASGVIDDSSIGRTQWQGRPAYIWRALLFQEADATQARVWGISRERFGYMDNLSMTADGRSSIFNIDIETHAALNSPPSGLSMTELGKIDATDTAYTFLIAAANGKSYPNATTSASSTIVSLPGGGTFDWSTYNGGGF